MSAFPSPVKSPTFTSPHVAAGFQVVHRLVVNPPEPLDSDTHHWPVCKYRPAISVCPSPLKSPVTTSTQVAFGFQVVARELLNAEPFDVPSHHWPLLLTRPMMSTRGMDVMTTSLPSPPL